jgi:hypothetical protein
VALCESEGTSEGVAEGLGVSEAAASAAAEVEAVATEEGGALGESLGDALALGEPEGCAGWALAAVVSVALAKGEGEAVDVEVGEGVGACVAVGSRGGRTVLDALAGGVGVRRALGECEQVAGADRPTARQPPQGQGVGAPLPGGQ